MQIVKVICPYCDGPTEGSWAEDTRECLSCGQVSGRHTSIQITRWRKDTFKPTGTIFGGLITVGKYVLSPWQYNLFRGK